MYKALLQRRAALIAQAATLRAGLEAANLTPEASADLLAQAKEVTAQLQAVNADLAALQAMGEAEAAAQTTTAAAALPNYVSVTPRVEQDPRRGFRDLADFARAVAFHSPAAAARGAESVDRRLVTVGQIDGTIDTADAAGARIGAAPTNYHQEGHSAEGYMVPPEFREAIWGLVFADDDLLALTNPETTSSNGFDWIADETTPWGTTGIQAYWTAEGAQKTQSKLDTAARQFRLHKLAALVLATDELLEDAPRLNARLTAGAGRAIQWKASDAIMWGTGAGQPLGWMNSPALVSVAKESAQGAATLLPKNVLKMYSRMLDLAGSRWSWVMNRNVVPELVDMKIGNEPSWTSQNSGLKEAPGGLLLGVPIRFSAHASTLGTQGDVSLVDFAGYYAAIKSGGVKFETSIHLYFDYDISAFRWVFRVGGQPFLSAPVPQAHGSTTQTQFITLDTRS